VTIASRGWFKPRLFVFAVLDFLVVISVISAATLRARKLAP
jgi:hypothetical protein